MPTRTATSPSSWQTSRQLYSSPPQIMQSAPLRRPNLREPHLLQQRLAAACHRAQARLFMSAIFLSMGQLRALQFSSQHKARARMGRVLRHNRLQPCNAPSLASIRQSQSLSAAESVCSWTSRTMLGRRS